MNWDCHVVRLKKKAALEKCQIYCVKPRAIAKIEREVTRNRACVQNVLFPCKTATAQRSWWQHLWLFKPDECFRSCLWCWLNFESCSLVFCTADAIGEWNRGIRTWNEGACIISISFRFFSRKTDLHIEISPEVVAGNQKSWGESYFYLYFTLKVMHTL